MKKKTKWQLALIVSVLTLTLYNILPTLFFYTKPLHRDIGAKEAAYTAKEITNRVNALEGDAHAWLISFGKLIQTPLEVSTEAPHLLSVRFKTTQEADRFKRFFPKAGSLIPFFPSTLSLNDQISEDPLVLHIGRQIPIALSESLFHFAPMHQKDGSLSPEYAHLMEDRILSLALAVKGTPENSALVQLALQESRPEAFVFIAQNILSIDKTLQQHPSLAKRFYATFTQGIKNPKETVDLLIQRMEAYKDGVQQEKIAARDAGTPTEEWEAREEKLLSAIAVLKKNKAAFISTTPIWTASNLLPVVRSEILPSRLSTQDLLINDNPVIERLSVNFEKKEASLTIRSDLLALRERVDGINQIIYDEIARITRESGEPFYPAQDLFTAKLSSLPNSHSFLALDLTAVAKAQYDHARELLSLWRPSSSDLERESYPIVGWETFQTLPAPERHLSLVLYAPALTKELPAPGFKSTSVYIIAKDLSQILKKGGSGVRDDVDALVQLLKSQGFAGYPGTTYPLPQEYASDYIFELSDAYLPLLMATRETFTVAGSKKQAILELSNVEQRILTKNRIETAIHEDLLKWRDEYNQAQVDPTGRTRFDVPKPTKNVLWNNFLLSAKKYVRGDEKKILQWGLDLSGGKTVQIALKDANNRPVTSDSDLKQAINELFARVNKMGVSDVSIRQEGSGITLDFPGSQTVSATELVKASSMTFNIVNEAFAPEQAEVNKFLQEVWNEAIVTNKKDIDSVNRIAWSHLYGEAQTDAAKTLYNKGLRLSDPNNPDVSNTVNDQESRLAMYRGDNYSEWGGRANPLLIVFKNYALEGSNLEGVTSGYNPSRGNFLSFSVKKPYRSGLQAWTGLFAKDKIMNSPYESYTKGRGWRMAVILNGFVVSAPSLESALRDSGMITGHFTQREISKLVSDLQAGSLSFTPQILSEKTVSPELGLQERTQGITATAIALVSVIIVMCTYYRFGGVVASVAVLINLLILWATLQNIGATITLAGLAGIILTMGMAIDANVLVFERVREEFAKTKKLGPAIQSGYRRAFSAILDSNITTIIAAFVLLHFDSGPIKGFAITLIIGIVSSMFTALFMTKYFFTEWVNRTKTKELRMMNLIKPQTWNFLRYGKPLLISSALVIVLGMLTLTKERHTIFGMDFTGGFAVHMEFSGTENARADVERILLQTISPQDFQLRALGTENQLRIFLGKSLAQPGKPFYQMPLELQEEFPTYSYETNPRLVWLVNTLQKGGLQIKDLSTLDQNWRSISGQMSDSMKHNAVIGLLIACLCILVYITVRFEFTYAISATLGLVFDIFMTLAALAFLHLFGVNIQIDLNTVAAILTIAGYSLNDTIIVFDRVREEAKHQRHLSFKELINYALNATLSRTLLTSGTTLLVLLCLVLFGGKTLFGFSLVMVLGVIIGTLSTFFIASPLLLLFQRKEKPNQRQLSLE